MRIDKPLTKVVRPPNFLKMGLRYPNLSFFTKILTKNY